MNKKIIFIYLITTALVSTACLPVDRNESQPSVDVNADATGGEAIEIMDATANTTPLLNGDTPYPVIDSGQVACYDDSSAIPCPVEGEAYYGQDAQYSSSQPAYQDNGDGTITDLNTGLMWMQDAGDKVFYYEAIENVETFTFAGYDDWRVPTIKELYSLIDFSGIDNAEAGTDPFIDRDYFVFEYGDVSAGERAIDSQWITSNIYVDSVMGGQECFFGVNFADGRIKCYPTRSGGNNGYFLRLVRGGETYGENDLVDNGDGTITDLSVGLMWQQSDSSEGVDWEDSLGYCENLDLAGYTDWRLPNAKELQYIVDYTRSPDTSDSAAIDPLFEVSEIVNEAGEKDYPFYWTSTTHANMMGGRNAVYISFGRALGYFHDAWIDVHGAGAQRSDPKSGDPDDYPISFGPQGDAGRVYNYARCVRGGVSDEVITGGEVDESASGNVNPPIGNSGPTGPGGAPPQEAIDACSGMSADDPCLVGPGSGTCMEIQGQLACVPEGGPPGGGSGPPQGGGQ